MWPGSRAIPKWIRRRLRCYLWKQWGRRGYRELKRRGVSVPITASHTHQKEFTMRRVLYRVAASLDGFIAGPNGEVDWIVPDPTVDFASLYASVDTVLLGRRTYEQTLQPGAPPWPGGWRIYVCSRTLDASQHPKVTVVSGNIDAVIAAL